MKQAIACDRKDGGFSLIELLVVVAIITTLAGMLLPALSRAKSQVKFITEINSAKQLMLAWQMYADDNHDYVLPGYRYGYNAKDRRGEEIGHPINARYPWRLAPYLANNFEILYVNRNRSLLHEFAQDDEDSYTYAASVFPSLAINSIFVGGDDLALPPEPRAIERFGRFCVIKQSDAQIPSRLIAFVSARSKFNGDAVEGYYRAEAPYLTTRNWTKQYDPQQAPELTGFVHPRYSGRAVIGAVDGHAEGLDWNQLQDMRRWASPADKPDWTLTK